MIKPKILLILGGSAITILVLFYLSASLIGRRNSKNLFEYVTAYCGGSIECLDLYNEKPAKKSGVIGYETFFNFINNLKDIGLLKNVKKSTGHLEWRYSNNVLVGNVYTSYRRWISDFGYIGMFILQGIEAAFYTIYYEYIKNKKFNINSIKSMILIVYSYLSYPLFIHSIDSLFYSHTFRLAFVTQTIMMIVAYYFFIIIDFKLTDEYLIIKLKDKEYKIKNKVIGKKNNEKISN